MGLNIDDERRGANFLYHFEELLENHNAEKNSHKAL